MFERFTRLVWGSFHSQDELKKFLGLALASFFLIGAQWPVKLLKDSLLVGFLGADYQPNVKILAILLCFPITILYTLLLEYFRREKIIYLVAGTYTIISIIFAALLKAWTLGFAINIVYLANGFYLFAETLTAISIPSFWAFVNDVTNPEEAKRGYPIIVFFAQFGGLAFTLLGKYIPNIINSLSSNGDSATAFEAATPMITLTTTLSLFLFGLAVWWTVHTVRRSNLQGYRAKGDATPAQAAAAPQQLTKFSAASFLNGIFLLFSQPYVFGIFLLTAFQEISGSLMQYSLLRAIGHDFLSKMAVNDFMFNYGVAIQVVAVVFSLVGASWFQRKLGVRGCLLGYPMFLALIFIAVLYWPSVYVIAMCTALAKGLHYALNKPVREMLYIPTSLDIKYRSKAWIEVFGSRIAKTTGASINKLSQTSVPGLLGIALATLPFIWLGVAKLVGGKYDDSLANREKIS